MKLSLSIRWITSIFIIFTAQFSFAFISQLLTFDRNINQSKLHKIRENTFVGNSYSRMTKFQIKAQSDDETGKKITTTAEKNNNDISMGSENIVNLRPSYFILFALLLSSISNQWSRQAIYYLSDFSSNGNAFKHMNIALDFSQESYAALASIVFSFVFIITSLFAGGIADRYNRKYSIILSTLLSSLTTILQSFVTSFNMLVPLRCLNAFSQAFTNPVSYTLISDVFPKSLIGSVNGLYSSGIYLGGGLASLSVIIDDQIGWRYTLLVIGALGILASILDFFIVKDPKFQSLTTGSGGTETLVSTTAANQATSTTTKVTTRSSSSSITGILNNYNNKEPVTTSLSSNSTNPIKSPMFSETVTAISEVLSPLEVKLILLAAALRFCGGYTIGVWKAPFIFAKFPNDEKFFASFNALIVGGAGLLSSLAGGYVSDVLVSDKNQVKGTRARMWVPAIGSFLAIPFWISFITAPTPTSSLLFLLVEYLLAECWLGPSLAAMFTIVPSNRKGTAQSIFSILTAFGSLSPLLVGALTGGSLASFPLNNTLLVVISISYLLSGLIFAYVALLENRRDGNSPTKKVS